MSSQPTLVDTRAELSYGEVRVTKLENAPSFLSDPAGSPAWTARLLLGVAAGTLRAQPAPGASPDYRVEWRSSSKTPVDAYIGELKILNLQNGQVLATDGQGAQTFVGTFERPAEYGGPGKDYHRVEIFLSKK